VNHRSYGQTRRSLPELGAALIAPRHHSPDDLPRRLDDLTEAVIKLIDLQVNPKYRRKPLAAAKGSE